MSLAILKALVRLWVSIPHCSSCQGKSQEGTRRRWVKTSDQVLDYSSTSDYVRETVGLVLPVFMLLLICSLQR